MPYVAGLMGDNHLSLDRRVSGSNIYCSDKGERGADVIPFDDVAAIVTAQFRTLPEAVYSGCAVDEQAEGYRRYHEIQVNTAFTDHFHHCMGIW